MGRYRIVNFNELSAAILPKEELAEIVLRAPQIRSWLKAIEEQVLEDIYERGEEYPCVKVVRGQGRRAIKDPDGFLTKLQDEGIVIDGLSKTVTKLESISTIERKLKMKLEDSPGAEFVSKSEGSLSLVPVDDKRKGVTKNGETASAYAGLFE
jgi:hypothetical protein